MKNALLIDTNLLVLYVVGTASKDYIARHKKLTAYLPEDYDALAQLVAMASNVVVTPNTLTETSNLAAMIGEPARSEVLAVLKQVADLGTEIYVPSMQAAANLNFIKLGLADAASVEGLSENLTLLTTDLDLHIAALVAGRSSVNFNEIRDQYL